MDEIVNWMGLDDEIIGRLQANGGTISSSPILLWVSSHIRLVHFQHDSTSIQRKTKLLPFSQCCLFAQGSEDEEDEASAMAEGGNSWEMAVTSNASIAPGIAPLKVEKKKSH